LENRRDKKRQFKEAIASLFLDLASDKGQK